jgi:hypothetical protein
MIPLTIAGYGLFCLAFVAHPGRRDGRWLSGQLTRHFGNDMAQLERAPAIAGNF